MTPPVELVVAAAGSFLASAFAGAAAVENRPVDEHDALDRVDEDETAIVVMPGCAAWDELWFLWPAEMCFD